MFPSSELLKVSSVASEGVMTWWRVLIHKESNVKCKYYWKEVSYLFGYKEKDFS